MEICDFQDVAARRQENNDDRTVENVDCMSQNVEIVSMWLFFDAGQNEPS